MRKEVVQALQDTRVRKLLFRRVVASPCGCHRWDGAHSSNNRPAFSLMKPTKFTVSAYSAVFVATKGRAVRKGLVLCHTCDNEWCVNVEHLEEKTHRENLQDRYLRGRYPSRYKTRKLTDEQVRDIRRKCHERSSSQEIIGKEYGVSRSVILGIHRREKYKDVTD